MNILQTLTQYLSNRAARKAGREEARREAEMRRRLDELVLQTRSRYETRRYIEGRKAALKNKPPRLKRIPYAWKREGAGG